MSYSYSAFNFRIMGSLLSTDIARFVWIALNKIFPTAFHLVFLLLVNFFEVDVYIFYWLCVITQLAMEDLLLVLKRTFIQT